MTRIFGDASVSVTMCYTFIELTCFEISELLCSWRPWRPLRFIYLQTKAPEVSGETRGLFPAADLPPSAYSVSSVVQRQGSGFPHECLFVRSVGESSLLPMNSGIVASPSALIPSRRRTFQAVSQRIFRSSQNDRLSTYQTSRRNFSSQEMALRPFTCAQPVIPGRTSWRRACSGEYLSR